MIARLAACVLKRIAPALGVCLFVTCGVLADDVTISDQSFDCIVNWPKIRNTRINNPDPQSLEKAMRIFQDSVASVEYPAGTILQLVPFEAMVKRSAETFPKTHGWEFFSLDVSGSGTTSKYPPAEPGALVMGPLEAAGVVADATPIHWAT